MSKIIKEELDLSKFADAIIAGYPAKVGKKRAKSICSAKSMKMIMTVNQRARATVAICFFLIKILFLPILFPLPQKKVTDPVQGRMVKFILWLRDRYMATTLQKFPERGTTMMGGWDMTDGFNQQT